MQTESSVKTTRTSELGPPLLNSPRQQVFLSSRGVNLRWHPPISRHRHRFPTPNTSDTVYIFYPDFSTLTTQRKQLRRTQNENVLSNFIFSSPNFSYLFWVYFNHWRIESSSSFSNTTVGWTVYTLSGFGVVQDDDISPLLKTYRQNPVQTTDTNLFKSGFWLVRHKKRKVHKNRIPKLDFTKILSTLQNEG